MRWPNRRNREPGAKRPARMLAWAAILGLLFGLVAAGEYPEDRLRVIRNHINERPASGEIVLVGIDEKSVREVGRWRLGLVPAPRRGQESGPANARVADSRRPACVLS